MHWVCAMRGKILDLRSNNPITYLLYLLMTKDFSFSNYTNYQNEREKSPFYDPKGGKAGNKVARFKSQETQGFEKRWQDDD